MECRLQRTERERTGGVLTMAMAQQWSDSIEWINNSNCNHRSLLKAHEAVAEVAKIEPQNSTTNVRVI